MGEKVILTEEMIDEKLAKLPPREIRFVDPMKMPMWTLATAVEMVDHGVSKKTLERAIETGELAAFRPGSPTCVSPSDFLVWFKRFRT